MKALLRLRLNTAPPSSALLQSHDVISSTIAIYKFQ